MVTALVEKVLPPDRIQEIEQKMKAYVTPRATERSIGSDGDVEAEGTDEEESTG